ncbi:MAG: hypothetical protein AABX23_04755 [Nanoarchaeota archaeon]
MNRKGKSTSKQILTGIAVFVLGSLIIGAISGLFSSPKPIRILNTEQEVCPLGTWFDFNGEGSFSIELKNEGSTGNLFVNISSNELLVKNKERAIFSNSSLNQLVTSAGDSQRFNFETLRKNQESENITIRVDYGCTKLFCKKYYFCCEYSKEDKDNYNLVRETSCMN